MAANREPQCDCSVRFATAAPQPWSAQSSRELAHDCRHAPASCAHTGPRVLTSAPRGNQSPAVAPDGNSIAFTSGRDGNAEVYQMDIDGANPRRLTTTRERESLPRFLPGGDLVYAIDAAAGGLIVRHAAGAPIRLVSTGEPVVGLAVDHDGSRLAWVTGRPGARRAETRLFVQRMAGDAAPTAVPGGQGEQLGSPSF